MANGFLGGLLGGISAGAEAGLERGERQRERQIQQQQFAKQIDLQQRQLAQALQLGEQEFALKRQQLEFEQAEPRRAAIAKTVQDAKLRPGVPKERVLRDLQDDLVILDAQFPGASQEVLAQIDVFFEKETERKAKIAAKREARIERPLIEEIIPTRQSLVEKGLTPEEATGAQVMSGLQTILPTLGQVTGVGVPTAQPGLPFVAGVRGARQAGQSAFGQSLSRIFGALGPTPPQETPIPRQQ